MREALSETATAAVPDAVRVQEKDKPFSHFTLGCSKETGAQGEGIAEGFRACGGVCVCACLLLRDTLWGQLELLCCIPAPQYKLETNRQIKWKI